MTIVPFRNAGRGSHIFYCAGCHERVFAHIATTSHMCVRCQFLRERPFIPIAERTRILLDYAGVEIRPVNPNRRSPDDTRPAGATPAPCSTNSVQSPLDGDVHLHKPASQGFYVPAGHEFWETAGRDRHPFTTQTDRVYAYVTAALTVALAFAMLMIGG